LNRISRMGFREGVRKVILPYVHLKITTRSGHKVICILQLTSKDNRSTGLRFSFSINPRTSIWNVTPSGTRRTAFPLVYR